MLDDLDVLAESSENICVRFIWFSPFFVCFYIGEKFSTISDCVYSSETDTGEDFHCHVHQRRTLFPFFFQGITVGL